MKSRVLKFHRDVRQHVQRRLREVVGLVDAYGRGAAPRVHVRIPVAVALVFRIEQVVDQQAQPNAARRTGAERIGEVEVGHDVDANQDLAAKYKVETIPTLVVFEGGKEVKRSVGVQPKPAILAMLK